MALSFWRIGIMGALTLLTLFAEDARTYPSDIFAFYK